MLSLTLGMANFLFLLLASTIQQVAATNITAPVTVSLWLPYLPNALHQNLDASAIGVHADKTTYALSCPTGSGVVAGVSHSKRADAPEPACIINGPLPQTVTAGPSTIIMTRPLHGNYESWGCHYGGTKNATCSIHSTWQSITLAGHTQGKGQELSSHTYVPSKIVVRPVTVTAGCLTDESKGAHTSTSKAMASSSSATPASSLPQVVIPLTGSHKSASASTSASSAPHKAVSVSTTEGVPYSKTTKATSTHTGVPASVTSATSSLVMKTANAAATGQLGSQGSWFALFVGIMGLVI